MELQGLDLSSQLLATKMKQTKNTTDKIHETVVQDTEYQVKSKSS